MPFLLRRDTGSRSRQVSSQLFGLIVVVILSLSHHPSAFGASVTLAWDPPASGGVTGYKIYRGIKTQEYVLLKTIGNTAQYMDDTLVAGTKYYYAVKAYNSYGDSGYSNELVYTPPTTTANRAPVASNGSLALTEDAAKGGALSATDADGNPLTFSIVAQGSKGTAAITNASTGAYTYTPGANATGSDTFSFKASDGSLSSNTASVSVSITPVNDQPVAAPDSAQTYRGQPVTISVLANDTDVDGDPVSLTSATQGTYGATTLSGSAVKYTPNNTFTGTDSFTYKVADGKGGAATGTVTVKVYADASSSGTTQPVIMAINAGGGQYTGADGTTYRADAYFSGGTARSTTEAIASTSDDTLYQTRRTGSFSYELPVSNGSYMLTLKFAETYFASAGQRVFDVLVEGRKVVTALDILAKAGGAFIAHDVTVPVNIQDGSVSIQFGSVISTPQLNALVLKRASQLTRLGVDCGGARLVASDGQVYEQDSWFSGGQVYSTSAAISGTIDDTLYRSERFGSFSYSLPVINGLYLVTFRFAELYWDKAGKRIFDVLMEGNEMISNLDVFAKVGKNAAYDQSVLVNVTDGVLNITFRTDRDNAKVSGILVQPAY